MKGPCENCYKERKLRFCIYPGDPQGKGRDLCRPCWVAVKAALRERMKNIIVVPTVTREEKTA